MTINATTLLGGKSTPGSIANWINRSDLPVADILTEAEAFIWQRLRVEAMLARATITIADGDDSVEKPADYLDPLQLRPFGWGDDLRYVTQELLNQQIDEDGDLLEGTPSRWTVIGDNIVVDVAVDAEWRAKLIYYALPPPLAAGSNETNLLTTRFPSLLRLTSLYVGYQFAKDWEAAQQQLPLVMDAIGSANAVGELSRRGQYA